MQVQVRNERKFMVSHFSASGGVKPEKRCRGNVASVTVIATRERVFLALRAHSFFIDRRGAEVLGRTRRRQLTSRPVSTELRPLEAPTHDLARQ